MLMAPSSPDGPPPPVMPRSPDGPPPDDPAPAPFTASAPFHAGADDDDDDDDDDPHLIRTLKLRSMAVAMAGGEDVWDTLDDETMRKYLENAEFNYDEADDDP
jgi:hypothetical protein